jgi:hypothetical protein
LRFVGWESRLVVQSIAQPPASEVQAGTSLTISECYRHTTARSRDRPFLMRATEQPEL